MSALIPASGSKKREMVDVSSLLEGPKCKRVRINPLGQGGGVGSPDQDKGGVRVGQPVRKFRFGVVDLAADEWTQPGEIRTELFHLIGFVRRFVARQHSTPARGQTRLVYVVTDSNGSNPRHLHINRANSSSLPTPGKESRYVDHVVLVACAKTYRDAITSFHEGSPFVFISPTTQHYRFGPVSMVMPKMQDCDTLATIKLDDTLIQRAVAMFHSGSMQCTAKDLWEPFEYLDHSEPLVHLVLNPATLRFAVEPRWHGAPVSLGPNQRVDSWVYCARVEEENGTSILIEDDGQQSIQPAPRHDDPEAGLPGFRLFVNKVFGIGSCPCPTCEFQPTHALHVALQCTHIQYEYTTYGKSKVEDVITVKFGKPLF